MLEVNPRASRTVPFVAKVIGQPDRRRSPPGSWPASACRASASSPRKLDHVAVKEAVFPFARFPGVDTCSGPEMRSTGEVMGLDRDFAMAFAKSQLGAGTACPSTGTVFVSVKDADKPRILRAVKRLLEPRLQRRRHRRHPALPRGAGHPCDQVNKVLEGRPHIVDAMKNGEVQLVFNTTEGAVGGSTDSNASATPR